ncbi:hypothetical protein [Gracilimonas sp.]|uniref:hypothetical protein n=1 Tax=Gracilimonas sp. TaxID=1974203 RepID=UPI0032EAC890
MAKKKTEKVPEFYNYLNIPIDVYHKVGAARRNGIGKLKGSAPSERESRIPASGGSISYDSVGEASPKEEYKLIIDTDGIPSKLNSMGQNIEGIQVGLGSTFKEKIHHIETVKFSSGYRMIIHFKKSPFDGIGPDEHVDPQVKHPDGFG